MLSQFEKSPSYRQIKSLIHQISKKLPNNVTYLRLFLLELLPFLALVSAIFVITADNPILGVLFLIGVFLTVSGYLALIGLTFLALTYLIIYVGAIAILFLFVVMMMDLNLLDLSELPSVSFPVAAILASSLLASLISLLNQCNIPFWFDSLNLIHLIPSLSSTLSWSSTFHLIEHLHVLGLALYVAFPLLLIIVGLILLLAIIGPIVLCL